MNRQEKIMFIEELTNNVKNQIIEKVDKMPEAWDGMELRQYLSDKFKEATMPSFQKLEKGRMRKYYNTLRISNL